MSVKQRSKRIVGASLTTVAVVAAGLFAAQPSFASNLEAPEVRCGVAAQNPTRNGAYVKFVGTRSACTGTSVSTTLKGIRVITILPDSEMCRHETAIQNATLDCQAQASAGHKYKTTISTTTGQSSESQTITW